MNIEFTKEIVLNKEYHIVVAGGGPSGCAAAIAAAREGAKVLLAEASGSLGGMGTSGLVPAWCPFSDGQKIIYRGIALEVFERTKKWMKHVKVEDVDWTPIDAEALKRVYDEMICEAGVTVLFHTQIISVMKDGEKITRLIAANKAGLTAFESKIYIDCTGDADLVEMAGLPFQYGNEADHEVQPVTHCFTLTNVDEYHYLHSPFLHMHNPDSAIYDIARSPKYPMVTDAHCCNSLIGPRVVGFNAGHLWDVNATDPFQVSKALMAGRQLAHQLHEGLKEYLPETYGASHLTVTAPSLGIRESRRIVGEYTITFEDYIKRRSFPDEIGRNCYFLDVHHTEKEKEKVMEGVNRGDENWETYSPGESHGIPYRSLIPKGISNLLTAGRSISCERKIQGSLRVMPVCLVTGQAAGTAAWLALSTNDVQNIDTGRLRDSLRQRGAFFE